MHTTKMILIVMSVAMLSAGCVTTGKQHEAESQQLQSRIADLETEVQSKDREIAELERALEQQNQPSAGEQQQVAAPVSKLSDEQVQTALKNAGFYNGPVDGRIGKKTKAAISAFQKAHGLKADGVAGRKTRAALMKYLYK